MATSTVPAFMAALVAMITTALAAEPDVLVCWGDPDTLPDDIVTVQGVTVRATPATMGTNRARDENYSAYVTVSCHVGGGSEAQQPATERAYALLALVEAALRADPTAQGTVRVAQVAGHDMTPSLAVDPDSGAVTGRVCEIVTRVDVTARI